jgi:exonuclease VII large subunit
LQSDGLFSGHCRRALPRFASMLAVIGNLVAVAVASTLFAKTLFMNRR